MRSGKGREREVGPGLPAAAGGAHAPAARAGPPAVAGADSPARSAATGGRTVREAAARPELSREESLRYSRHLRIPEVGPEGQTRLKEARVLIVGAGGLGSPAALYLAAAGVGTLGLVDDDVVDLTNLQRQLLHDTASVGEPKLASARRRLEALNPGVRLETFETRLASENALGILEGWDLVVDGSDNFPTRYLVNDACHLLGLPLVYGAVHRFEGQVSVFGHGEGPCYRCLFREPPPPGLVPSCAEAGVLGVLPGVVGTLQAVEAVKLILGRGRPLSGRLLLFDALEMEFREVRIARDPGCPLCGEAPTVTELVDYERFCGETTGTGPDGGEVPAVTVRELARRSEEGEAFELLDVREPYEWRICNLEGLGARLVPLGQLPGRLEELDREAPLVVHCRSGERSAEAVRLLRRHGFDGAVNLEGGILAWAREVDPEMPTY